ncbi:MAG: NUDIX hydrolase [Candidatus Binataceae bacterium]|nr:NUDIX hydrolase [Candidatus Binataceae bacterium]
MRAAESGQGDFRGTQDTQIRGGSVAPRVADGLRDAPIARPKVAVDTVLFAIAGGRLKCYLVQLGAGSAAGKWAFPGGLVHVGETLDEAARRELSASTGQGDRYLEQLFSFGDPSRDPTAHVVSIAYMALIDDAGAVQACSQKYAGGQWFEVARLPALAYDHAVMADYALRRLRAKFEYTNIACHLLKRNFTFAELEELYATVLERPLDRRNFRRRILAMGLLRRLADQRRGAHRPAALYTFRQHSLQMIEML